jgi:hypothetical protein
MFKETLPTASHDASEHPGKTMGRLKLFGTVDFGPLEVALCLVDCHTMPRMHR